MVFETLSKPRSIWKKTKSAMIHEIQVDVCAPWYVKCVQNVFDVQEDTLEYIWPLTAYL